MKFGVFYEHQLPRPWVATSEYDLLQQSLDQFFTFRPLIGWAQYRTPIKGLYLCGAGTHPGGGVTGRPGANASREIIKDFKSSRI